MNDTVKYFNNNNSGKKLWVMTLKHNKHQKSKFHIKYHKWMTKFLFIFIFTTLWYIIFEHMDNFEHFYFKIIIVLISEFLF